jgi:hypothetical protein
VLCTQALQRGGSSQTGVTWPVREQAVEMVGLRH